MKWHYINSTDRGRGITSNDGVYQIIPGDSMHGKTVNWRAEVQVGSTHQMLGVRRTQQQAKELFAPDLRVFLACELKPDSDFWPIIAPHVTNVKPAITHGRLGVMCYEPPTYSIVSIDPNEEPLVGYLLTFRDVTGIRLVDKVKGFYGTGGYNIHIRRAASVSTSPTAIAVAWAYVIAPRVLDQYERIEQVEWGMWQEDDNLSALLDRFRNSNDD